MQICSIVQHGYVDRRLQFRLAGQTKCELVPQDFFCQESDERKQVELNSGVRRRGLLPHVSCSDALGDDGQLQ